MYVCACIIYVHMYGGKNPYMYVCMQTSMSLHIYVSKYVFRQTCMNLYI